MSQKRVIVVDDSLTIRKMIEMGLRPDGYEVIATQTGEECLAAATGSIPDLIVMDYTLPDMQATELCQWLMQSPVTMGVPVLLISGDGDAARQLYQDAENVVDYLTKPFAPNVLKAVVNSLLTRPEADPKLKSTIIVPSDGSQPGEVEEDAGALDVSEKLMKKFDQLLRSRLATASKNIPEWEAQRGDQSAEAYYVDRFVKAGLLLQITRDMLGATTLREDVVFRFKSDFMSVVEALTYLESVKATGMFRVELPQETVLVFLEAGEIIAITSNDARSYCKGAAVDFRNLPQDVVMAAVVAQRKSYIPFYVSLHLAGQLPDQEMFEGLLRSQGESSIARAIAAASVACSFTTMDPLPELVLQYSLNYALPQISPPNPATGTEEHSESPDTA